MEAELMVDAELLRDLIDEEKFTIKKLAYRSGLSSSSIYKMLTGERNVKTSVLQAAFNLTGDTRILRLILDGSGYIVQLMHFDPGVARAADPTVILHDWNKALVELVGCADRMAQISADGVIDHKDDAAIAELEAHHAQVMTIGGIAMASIHAARAKAAAPGGAS